MKTPISELLIRAAFAPSSDAIAAWRAFRQRRTIDALLGERGRLLSPIYTHLSNDIDALGHDRQRLAGIHRFAWTRYQIFADAAGRIAGILEGQGIDVMLVKGLAISANACTQPADRPLGNMDLLVRPVDAGRTLDILNAAGWRSLIPNHEVFQAGGCATVLQQAPGIRLLLHWRPLIESPFPTGSDDAIWAAKIQASIAGTPVWIPSPTDSLILSLARSISHWHCNRTLWALDSLLLLQRHAAVIDWQRAIQHTREWNLDAAVRSGLQLLRRTVPTLVPEAATPLIDLPCTASEAASNYRTRCHWAPFFRLLPLAWQRAKMPPGQGSRLLRVRIHMRLPSWPYALTALLRQAKDSVRYG